MVDAPLARLTVSGFKGPAYKVKQADNLWDQNALELESEEIHRHAMVGGEGYVIVWPTLDPSGQPIPGQFDITLQDERTMHMVYRSARRNDPLMAAKVWRRTGTCGEPSSTTTPRSCAWSRPTWAATRSARRT